MKKLLLFLLIALPLFSHDPSKDNKPATVKVLLAKLIDQSLVEVKGRCQIYNPKTDVLVASFTKSKRAKMTTKEEGLYWGELFSELFEIRIVPSDKNTRILIGGIQYKGCIDIYSIGGMLNIVNEVDAESYLKSTLSSKVTPTLSQETLDALVITERTNLYYFIEKDAFASWQLEAEKVNYTGEASARQNKELQDAVERTRGLIMSYEKKPFAATWSENLAGKSVSYPSIYRRSGHAPPGVSHLPSLSQRERTIWKATLPQKTLCELTGLPQIKEIDLYRAEKSEKVYAIRFIGDKGCRDISFFALQQALGAKTLPSNDFTVTVKGKKILFTGYGQGTGVGLCLTSAEMMASGKSRADKILTYHFPKAQLLNLPQETGKPTTTSYLWE